MRRAALNTKKIKRILVVDDDKIFRRFLIDYLSGRPGLEIVGEAADGRKALEQAEALNPDLVLLDSRMPRLNGFQASRLMLKKRPHLRVIILGVFNHLKDKQAAEECGACGYIQKLNVLEDLLPTMRAAFRNNRERKWPAKKKPKGIKKALGRRQPPQGRDSRAEHVERLPPTSLESERQYKSLVEKSLLGIYITQGHILKFCNNRFAQMFGAAGPGALTGISFRKLVAPESWDTVQGELELRESGQKEISPCQFKAVRGDGSHFEAEALGSRIVYEGRPAVQGIMIDISERKRAEKHLHYQAHLLDNVTDAVISTDLHYNIEYWNAAAEALYGWAAEEVMGHPLRDFIQDEFLRDSRETIMRTVLKEGCWKGEIIQNRRDGTRFPVLATLSLVRDGQGRPIGHIAVNRDITERRRAEEQIRLKEARLQSLYNISQYKPKDGRDLWDYALQEVIRLTDSQVGWMGAYREETQTLEANTWSREVMAVCKIKDRSVEFPVEKGGIWAEAIRRGGSLIINDYKADNPRKKGCPPGHLELRRLMAIPIFSEDKIVLLVVVANKEQDYDATDIRQLTLLMDSVLKITERKRAEEALAESEERFRTLFENSTIGLYRTSPQGRILLANPAIVRMLGFSSVEELGRRNLESEGFPHDFPRSRFRQQIDTEGEVRGLESAWKRADGQVIYVRESAKAIRDKEGKILYFEGTVEDITKKKRTEEALQKSEERFSLLFTFAPDAYTLSDLQGRIIDCNNAAEALSGYAKEEMIGKSFRELKLFSASQASQAAALLEKSAQSLSTGPDELILTRKDGQEIHSEIRTFPLIIGGKVQILGVARDVTERKAMESEVDKRMKELEEFYKMAVNRELRMIELKSEIAELKAEVEKFKDGQAATSKDLSRRAE